MSKRPIRIHNQYVRSSTVYLTEMERVRALHAAITMQAIKDIETATKRREHWQGVWASLKEIAPVYKMTRGEFVIRLATVGTIKISPEEIERRKVAVTAVEKDMLERYIDGNPRKTL